MPDVAKRTETTPELRKELFDFVFFKSPCGVGICDRSLRIIEVNPAWAQMDGRSPEEHVGKTVPEVLGVEACPVEDAMKEVLRTGEPIYKLKFAAKIPSRQALLQWTVNLIPIKNAAGETTHVGSFTLASPAKGPYLIPVENDGLDVGGGGLKKLSLRQRQVVALLAQGQTSKEIGAKLGISPHTVETHRKNILKILGIHSRSALVRLAMRSGLISNTPNQGT